MAQADLLYSRLVATLKVLLPLAALGLLSTLFLLARVPESELTGRLSGEIAADGRMQGSTFSAMTEDGPLTVTADTAIPRAADYAVVDLEGLRATLDIAGTREIVLTSDTARLTRPDREVEFNGAVRIRTSDGYEIESERIVSTFDGAQAESPGPVRLTGPGVSLEAGTMRVVETEGGSEAGRLLFNGGVRLVYVPGPSPIATEDPQ
ncbi:MAG: LPS export ABC transporter periplasmic protein LptC [Pseudomonadota bacterium]